MTLFSSLDSLVFRILFIVAADYGLWAYRRRKSAAGSSAPHEYVLADRIEHLGRAVHRRERFGFPHRHGHRRSNPHKA
jgi:hypothetical protein